MFFNPEISRFFTLWYKLSDDWLNAVNLRKIN